MIISTDADKQISNNGPDAKSVEGARAEEASVRDRVPLESKVKPISESHDAATSLQSKQAPNNANSRSFNGMLSLVILAVLAHNFHPLLKDEHCKK